MTALDWPRVRDIYLRGIATRNATFETECPAWEQWDAHHTLHSRLVGIVGDEVAGWAALRPISARNVYSGVAEVSIYVASEVRGHGVGKELLRNLIAQSEAHGVWTLQAGIFPENAASISLHQTLGFRKVGTRERLGQLDNQWRDVILLERRSTVVGT